MDEFIYLVSPLTSEISTYKVSLDSDFSQIIQEKELFFYNGSQVTKILPEDRIGDFLSKRRSQILFLTSYIDLPLIKTDQLLVFILTPNLHQLIPLILSSNVKVQSIINYLKDKHHLMVTLTKLESGMTTDILNSEETIGEILPLRTGQILLLMKEQSSMTGRTKFDTIVSYLESLPLELKMRVISDFSVPDILNLCQISKELAKMCKFESLWNDLVQRDFGSTIKSEETWKEEYQKLMRKRANEILKKAALKGDLEWVNYALFYNADNYNEGLIGAAEKSDIEILKLMLTLMKEYYIIPDYGSAMNAAAGGGQIEIFKFLESLDRSHSTFDYYVNIIEAAERGQLEMVRFLLKIMRNRNVQPEYEAILIVAAENGHQDLVKFLLEEIGSRAYVNQGNALPAAAASGNLNIVNMILEKMRQLDIKPHKESFLKGAVKGGNIEIVELALKSKEDIHFDGSNQVKSYNSILSTALDNGHTDLFYWLLNIDFVNNKVDYEYLLPTPVARGDIKTFDFLFNKIREKDIIPDYDDLLEYAEAHNQPEMVAHILSKVKEDKFVPFFDDILGRALHNKYWEIVKILINYMKNREVELDEEGLDNLYVVAQEAAGRGDLNLLGDTIKVIESKDLEPDYNQILERAAEGGYLEIILDLSKDKDYYKLMNLAAEGGNLKLFRYLSKIAKYDDETLAKATKGGNLEILKLILNKLPQPNYNYVIEEAVSNKQYQVVEFLLNIINREGLKVNYNTFLLTAIETGDVKMFKLILRKMGLKLSKGDVQKLRMKTGRNMMPAFLSDLEEQSN